MSKIRVTFIILIVILIGSLSASVVIYREKLYVEEQQVEHDINVSFSMMMLMDAELRRFISMYEREALDQELLDEHRNVLWGICNASSKLKGARPFNNIRYIVVQDIDEVDEELYSRYLELSEYIFSLYLNIPDSYEVDGEVFSDELDYLNNVFISDEHKKEIQRILGLK